MRKKIFEEYELISISYSKIFFFGSILFLICIPRISLGSDINFQVVHLQDLMEGNFLHLIKDKNKSCLKIKFDDPLDMMSSSRRKWIKCEIESNLDKIDNSAFQSYLNFKNVDQALPLLVIKKDSKMWNGLKKIVHWNVEKDWMNPDKVPFEVYALISTMVIKTKDDKSPANGGSILFVNWYRATGKKSGDIAYYKELSQTELEKVKAILSKYTDMQKPFGSLMEGIIYHDWLSYEIGQVAITQQHRQRIKDWIKHIDNLVKRDDNMKITIHLLGFADKKGRSEEFFKQEQYWEMVNQAVSWARIRVCKDALISDLLSMDRELSKRITLSVYWYGNYSANRLFENYPNIDQSYNRRVELIISDKKEWKQIGLINVYEQSWKETQGHNILNKLRTLPHDIKWWPIDIRTNQLYPEDFLDDHMYNRGKPQKIID